VRLFVQGGAVFCLGLCSEDKSSPSPFDFLAEYPWSDFLPRAPQKSAPAPLKRLRVPIMFSSVAARKLPG
jgi:hypothetical protein